MVKKISQTEIDNEKKELKEILKPGDTVYTILRSCSRSGMSRSISLYIFPDGEPRMLDWAVCKICGYSLDKNKGVKIGGCGMDMGFTLVYALSDALYGDGYKCLGKGCPSNFHVNNRIEGATEPIHTDGYAIKHRWL